MRSLLTLLKKLKMYKNYLKTIFDFTFALIILTVVSPILLITCFIYDRIALEISKSDKDFPGIFSNVPLMPDIDLTKTTFYALIHS